MRPAPPTPKAQLVRLLSSRECVQRVYELARSIYPQFPSQGSAMLVRMILAVSGSACVRGNSPHQLAYELLQQRWGMVPRTARLEPGDVFFLGEGTAKTASFVLKQPESSDSGFIALEWEPTAEGECWSRRVKFNEAPIMLVLRMPCLTCGQKNATQEVLRS